MAWTQSDIDSLKAAIAKGVKVVQMGTERVEYASIAEMRSILGMMEAEVAGTSRGSISVSYPSTSRGL